MLSIWFKRPYLIPNPAQTCQRITGGGDGTADDQHIGPGVQRIQRRHHPLLVVEAMKMETAVAAPRAGTITQVSVAEGDVVAVGDPLVNID